MKNIKYLNAGAGSGKTYFLTSTLAELVLSKKCTPSEVIMTTFSEKAAADIKRNARSRFLEKKDYEAAAGLDAANIGTVHAVAYKYIQKYWYLLGISARCEVMTDDNKAAYIALTLGRETPQRHRGLSRLRGEGSSHAGAVLQTGLRLLEGGCRGYHLQG